MYSHFVKPVLHDFTCQDVICLFIGLSHNCDRKELDVNILLERTAKDVVVMSSLKATREMREEQKEH